VKNRFQSLLLRMQLVPLQRGSFAGSTNFYGKAGVQFYTQTKTVTASWREKDESAGSAAHVVMPTSQKV
jgi:malonate-semialdehyde dehydrogenase (acetylating)/methylmalonate-semialdehyde dehydrogenase